MGDQADVLILSSKSQKKQQKQKYTLTTDKIWIKHIHCFLFRSVSMQLHQIVNENWQGQDLYSDNNTKDICFQT